MNPLGFLWKHKKERNAVVWYDVPKRLGAMKYEAGSQCVILDGFR